MSQGIRNSFPVGIWSRLPDYECVAAFVMLNATQFLTVRPPVLFISPRMHVQFGPGRIQITAGTRQLCLFSRLRNVHTRPHVLVNISRARRDRGFAPRNRAETRENCQSNCRWRKVLPEKKSFGESARTVGRTFSAHFTSALCVGSDMWVDALCASE
jgi:hypothetical protein